jgi:hypothetical protein
MDLGADFCPATEHHTGSKSLKPGEKFTQHSGQAVCVRADKHQVFSNTTLTWSLKDLGSSSNHLLR